MASALDDLLAPFDPVPAGDAATRYVTDWPADMPGRARAILRPRSTEEVARIVGICAETGVPVVPQGGNTGLVGGGTPSDAGNEVVISLERMNRVREIDVMNFSMTVEAGCVLERVHEAAAAADRIFPLSLGAQGTCQIGGNIGTNAGGINVLRYGMTRNLVLGLEVVLPDGQVWNGLKKLHKNNAGYDLKQLFVGSEGTLGIVTAAALRLFPLPTQVETAFLAVESAAAAVALYGMARRDLSDLLSAFEILPRKGVDLALETVPDLRDPLATATPYYVLLEVSASGLVDLRALVERFLELAMEQGHVADGMLAANAGQAKALWRIREGLNEGQARRGRHLRTDVSVPISAITAFLEEAHAALAAAEPDALALAYGHVGDGNIHFNVLAPQSMPEEARIPYLHRCEEIIFAAVDRQGGSISAEHGIGRVKRRALEQRLPALDSDLMHRLKRAIDPQGTMNPGRIIG